jgi:hypothetical protein
MTVVAGCLLPDGAVIGADCRVTMTRADGSTYVSDTAGKLMRLGPATIIGFAGDVRTVAGLFHELLGATLARRRLDPISIRAWLPRLFKAAYAGMQKAVDSGLAPLGSVQPVWFLVASSVRGRPSRISKAKVMATAAAASERKLNNYLLLRVLNDLDAAGDDFVLPDSSMGMLYRLESPQFRPVDCPPLSFEAIGAGKSVLKVLEEYELLMAVDHPDRAPAWFIDSLRTFLRETQDERVGGLLLAAACQDGSVRALSLQEDESSAQRLDVTSRDGRFIVHSAGRDIVLRHPGELVRTPPSRSLVLDGLRQTSEEERERLMRLRSLLRPPLRKPTEGSAD